MGYLIGIDLGATNIKAVSLSEDGKMLSQCAVPTEDGAGQVWVEKISGLLSQFYAQHGSAPLSIGLAAPGLAARDGRSIAFMPGRMQGLEKLDWTAYLKSPQPVSVINDAHAHLLGEVWQGAAAGCRDAFLLTLGTGVGGAILAEGRLLKGHIGRGGHLGHICLYPDGPADITGIPGSLEDAIGECTLLRRSGGLFGSTRELVSAHRNGDSRASKIWLRSIYELACGIASLINVLDPQVVIVGGGIAQAGAALFEPLNEDLKRIEWRPSGHCAKIVPAMLGDRAGALGAAWHGLRMTEGKLK